MLVDPAGQLVHGPSPIAVHYTRVCGRPSCGERATQLDDSLGASLVHDVDQSHAGSSDEDDKQVTLIDVGEHR